MLATDYQKGEWDAARVLKALGRIGYQPVSALLDVSDNALSAGASKIEIWIRTTRSTTRSMGRPRAIIESFSILDNGTGMDIAGLKNALKLGSSPQFYQQGTLSKFGMGLKSAAFSLGNCLEIISRSNTDLNKVNKVVLDYEKIEESQGEYIYQIQEPTEQDVNDLNSVAQNSSGTLVRITKIHLASMPSPSDIIEGVKKRAGIVYYYYLAGKVNGRDKIYLNVKSIVDKVVSSDEAIHPIDPLFEDEATQDLDELTWNGLNVNWITRPSNVQISTDGNIFAEVAITQLPHPPSVGQQFGEAERKACREKYLIEANNYGFYIYRNFRLISWADNLEGLIPRDKKLYSFRGRINITSDSDDLLNIDVTKSRIQLSEIARGQLNTSVGEAKKKSTRAWEQRTQTLKNISGLDPHVEINEELDKVEKLAENDDRLDEEVAPASEQRKLSTRRQYATTNKPAKAGESKELDQKGTRVQYVPYLDNNQLWERAHDPQNGLFVRVNNSHRLYREIDISSEDEKLIKILALLFFSLARGEYSLVYKSQIDQEVCENVMQEFRERVGAELSEIVRRINVNVAFENDEDES